MSTTRKASLTIRRVPATMVQEFRALLAGARDLIFRRGRGRPASVRRDSISEIVAAERRIDAGVYGLCEACRRPISLRRLRESPVTRWCSRCQPKHARRSARGRAART